MNADVEQTATMAIMTMALGVEDIAAMSSKAFEELNHLQWSFLLPRQGQGICTVSYLARYHIVCSSTVCLIILLFSPSGDARHFSAWNTREKKRYGI